MTKNPDRAIIDRYPSDRLPSEVLSALEHRGFAPVVLRQLDEEIEVLGGPPYLDRLRGGPADPEGIADCIRWIRGPI